MSVLRKLFAKTSYTSKLPYEKYVQPWPIGRPNVSPTYKTEINEALAISSLVLHKFYQNFCIWYNNVYDCNSSWHIKVIRIAPMVYSSKTVWKYTRILVLFIILLYSIVFLIILPFNALRIKKSWWWTHGWW